MCQNRCHKTVKTGKGEKKATIIEMSRIARERGGKCLSNHYKNIKTKLKWECSLFHHWEAVPSDIKSGTWCPFCGGTKKLDLTEMRKIASDRGGKCLSEKYTNSSTKLDWQCMRGHKWEATPDKVKGGQWCPKCSNQTSKLEIRVFCELKSIFGKINVKWREKINKMECDVYIANYKIGIEVDGYPWHEGKEKKDKEKNKKLENEGIKLFRVRSQKLKLISKEDIQFKEAEAHFISLNKLLVVVRKAGILSTMDRDKVSEYLLNKKYSNEKDYRKVLSCLPGPLPEKSLNSLYPEVSRQWHPKKNTPLQPRMFSPKSNEKVWWLCEDGHEWKTTINHRTYGQNCPFCAGRRQTIGEMQLLAKSKGGDCLSVEYAGGHRHHLWKCDKEHEWKATPAHIKSGKWCPKCFDQKRGASQRLSIDDMHQIAGKKEGKCLSSYYKNAHTKLKWECKFGHQWEATSNKIRNRNQWCPFCSGRRTTIDNMKEIAQKRGGECLSDEYLNGRSKLLWRCTNMHTWKAIPEYIKAGSWCPMCSKKARWQQKIQRY